MEVYGPVVLRIIFAGTKFMYKSAFRISVVTLFLGIFFAKMVISIAPAFSFSCDKRVINNVIMQLELEHQGEKEKAGNFEKLLESKLFLTASFTVGFNFHGVWLSNNFIDHFKRYIDPYHPSVPTPPPNFS